MKLILITVLLPIVLLHAQSPCTGPVRQDGQCGPNAGGASCASGSCCSRFGFCGTGSEWCNANSICNAPGGGGGGGGKQTPPPNTAPPVKLPIPTIPGINVVRALSGCGQGKRVVALTFDDGPQPSVNSALLAELRANNVKATFFSSPQSNGPEQLQARCDVMKNILAEGHQVEHHSMTHPHFPSLGNAQIADELNRGKQFMKQCGASPRLFRPPFGELVADQARSIIKQFNMPIVLWNIDPRDFEGAGPAVNFGRVVSEFETTVGIGNSAIILLHELQQGQQSGLVTRLASYFRGLGYNFVTLDQCIASCQGPVCSSGGEFPDIIGVAAGLL